MKYTSILSFLLFVTVMIGCTKKAQPQLDKLNSIGNVHSGKTPTIYNAMANRADNPYMVYLDSSDCTVSFYTSNTLAAVSLGMTQQSNAQAIAPKNVGQFNISDVTIPYIGTSYQISDINTRKSNSNTLSTYFGKTVIFGCFQNGTYTVNQKLYIPPILQLKNIYGNNNKAIKVNSGAQLSWNADPNNQNGVVILVQVLDAKTNTYVRNIGFYPDNGLCTLDNSLFNNIPSGVQIEVNVIRGNIIIATGLDGLKYKLYGYSSCVAPFII